MSALAAQIHRSEHSLPKDETHSQGQQYGPRRPSLTCNSIICTVPLNEPNRSTPEYSPSPHLNVARSSQPSTRCQSFFSSASRASHDNGSAHCGVNCRSRSSRPTLAARLRRAADAASLCRPLIPESCADDDGPAADTDVAGDAADEAASILKSSSSSSSSPREEPLDVASLSCAAAAAEVGATALLLDSGADPTDLSAAAPRGLACLVAGEAGLRDEPRCADVPGVAASLGLAAGDWGVAPLKVPAAAMAPPAFPGASRLSSLILLFFFTPSPSPFSSIWGGTLLASRGLHTGSFGLLGMMGSEDTERGEGRPESQEDERDDEDEEDGRMYALLLEAIRRCVGGREGGKGRKEGRKVVVCAGRHQPEGRHGYALLGRSSANTTRRRRTPAFNYFRLTPLTHSSLILVSLRCVKRFRVLPVYLTLPPSPLLLPPSPTRPLL